MKTQKLAVFREVAAPWLGYPLGSTFCILLARRHKKTRRSGFNNTRGITQNAEYDSPNHSCRSLRSSSSIVFTFVISRRHPAIGSAWPLGRRRLITLFEAPARGSRYPPRSPPATAAAHRERIPTQGATERAAPAAVVSVPRRRPRTAPGAVRRAHSSFLMAS